MFALEGYDSTGFLLVDNVSVTDDGPFAPEPSTLVLLGAGLSIGCLYHKLKT